MSYKIVMKTGEVITFDNPRDFSVFIYSDYTGIDLDESYDAVADVLFNVDDEKYIKTLEKINRDFYYPRKFYTGLFDIVYKTIKATGSNLILSVLNNIPFTFDGYGEYITKFIHYSHNALFETSIGNYIWPLSDRDLVGMMISRAQYLEYPLTFFEWKEISYISLQTKTLLKKLSKIRDKLIIECFLVRESLI